MTQASDIPKDGWIDRWSPASARPYLRLARLDRPIGTWLLLIPCWWGVALAGPDWPEIGLMLLFAIGSVAMRGAGCTFNDIVDRDIDRRVARTADRPVASGQIGVPAAILFMAAQSLVGLAVLLSMNRAAILWGLGSLGLVAIYPFMKRITWWPQFVLGLAFNWGALVGYVAASGRMAPPALLLYAAGIAWTLGYDTIYAHQDKQDDAIVGVKSSARFLADRTRPFLYAAYAATIALLAASGLAAGLGWPFFLLLLAGLVHLFWQASTVDTEDPRDCLAKFRSNRDFGFILLAALVAGHLAA
ncbi:MAG: 4-hydroxybenzoate octaprenyltransferase [Alphaproteobacteria bacterium]|nr:4-hydroxybenzoate octaprenyltransferase [Alphaproteobacteria bacterium]